MQHSRTVVPPTQGADTRHRSELPSVAGEPGRAVRSDPWRSRLLSVVSLALLSAILAACAHAPRDEIGPPDRLLPPEPVAGERPEPVAVFSSGAAGQLLARQMKTMVDFGEGAARRHRVSLALLRSTPEETQQQMVSELVAAYARLPEPAYHQRWLVITLLAELGRAEALDFLTELALSDLPPERLSGGEHQASSQAEELAIRLAAVRGVGRLASRESPDADQSLLEIARSSSRRSVTIRAIHAYLYAPLFTMDTLALDDFRQSDEYELRLVALRESLPPDALELLEVAPLSPQLAPTPRDVIEAARVPRAPRRPPTAPGLPDFLRRLSSEEPEND